MFIGFSVFNYDKKYHIPFLVERIDGDQKSGRWHPG